MAKTTAAAAISNVVAAESAPIETLTAQPSITENMRAEALKAQFRAKIAAEPRVSVTLAPSYRAPFGQVMTVSLHGHSIFVPCNGRTYGVPRSYAAIIHARRRAYDEQELKMERMSAITQNAERYAGELQFG